VILVDSSVWIGYLRGTASPQAEKLDALLGSVPLAIGDLILTEILQGCATDREFNAVKRTLSTLHTVNLGGLELAIEAAKNFRKLRALGFTVRKTIDTVIATRCIMDGLELLHSDRDFDPFEKHLGLRCVRWDI
jgi:predicted nucleic acid-binding protein